MWTFPWYHRHEHCQCRMDSHGAFLVVAATVIVTPGPDLALTIRNGLFGGRKGGLSTAAGVALGQTLWVVTTSAGITAMLRASELAMASIRLGGAAYLAALGVWAVRKAFLREDRGMVPGPPAGSVSPRATFWQGALSNLSNPTAGVFFLSVLPRFAPAVGGWTTALLPGLAFMLLSLSWLTVCALLVDRVSTLLERPRIRQALEGITGAALVALGVHVALETI